MATELPPSSEFPPPAANVGPPQEPVFDTAALDPKDFPRLVELLAAQADGRLKGELSRLLQMRFRMRAARKAVKRTARLRYEGYDEVVMVRDISASGVRMLVPLQPPLDVVRATRMTLLVKMDNEVRPLPLTLVRVIGSSPQGLDVACRFLNPESENVTLTESLRSLFFA